MPQYDYSSSGGAASSALVQYLAEQEARQRQAMLDQLARENSAAANTRATADLDLRRQQEKRIAEHQTKTFEGLEQDRAAKRAETRYANQVPGMILDEATMAEQDAQGLEGTFTRVPGVAAGTDDSGEPLTDAQPAYGTAHGGSRYLSARAAEEARAAEGGLNRDARAVEGEANRELRELIARLGASGDAASQQLSNQLKQLQIDTLQTKNETADNTAAKDKKSAVDTASFNISQIDRMLTHPGLPKATGALDPRKMYDQEAIDFNSIRNQLVAALTLPNLGTLKGPMSDKDVVFIKQLATRIQEGRISDTELKTALNEAKRRMQGLGGESPDGASPAGAPGAAPTSKYKRTIR